MFRRTFLAAFAALSLAPAFAAPLEVTDALGRKVTINTPVNRVVATFNYEEFTAIAGVDGWKKVVGMSRTPWEGWRPAIFSRYTQVIPNLAAMPDVGHAEDNTFSASLLRRMKGARSSGSATLMDPSVASDSDSSAAP